jgi:hypothetical protein
MKAIIAVIAILTVYHFASEQRISISEVKGVVLVKVERVWCWGN